MGVPQRALRAILGLLVGGLFLVVPAVAKPKQGATLHIGQTAFWTSPYLKNADYEGDEGKCEEGCFKYLVRIADKSERLRVALDHPLVGGSGTFRLNLRGPDGTRLSPVHLGGFSSEIFVRRPEQGTWSIEVTPDYAANTAFRVRAKLEGKKASEKKRLLAPNLRVEPPLGFTFENPEPTVGPEAALRSCTVDEMAEDGARRCLRFSVGPQNAGLGPLELRFSPVTDAIAAEAPMFQRLTYSDGTFKERPAGTYEYHKTHGHYHFSGFAKLDLFRVTNLKKGTLQKVGKGNKSGFCFADTAMNSWGRFIHGRAHSARSSCESLTEGYMGLTAGWTDLYGWNAPGNYVEFSEGGDGYYIVRARVDAVNTILEAREDDNVSYAYVRVTGSRVRLLERGYGLSPWHPGHQRLIDWVSRLRKKG